jgi:hypothetical protein
LALPRVRVRRGAADSFCRKNAGFLSSGLRMYAFLRCFRSVCLGLASECSHFYGASAHFAHLGTSLGLSQHNIGMHILSLFVVLPRTLAILWHQFSYLGTVMVGCNFCRYLRCFRSLCPSCDSTWLILGQSWDATFVAICGASAHFAHLVKALGLSWRSIGMQMLSLFAVLPLTLPILFFPLTQIA